MTLLKGPSMKKLVCLVISCGLVIFIGICVVIKPANLNVVQMQSFSELPTPIKITNATLSFSASESELQKNASELFTISKESVPFNMSYFNIVRSDESFLKENTGSTLSKIASMIQVKEVKCSAIFNADINETSRADKIAKTIGTPISDEKYINLTSDCPKFKAERGYIMSSLTEEEENFPLAFSIVTYNGAEMFERLLRAIYRPQNYYCIQVDGSSSKTFFEAISGIASCFPNVFLVSRRIDVKWGDFTVLESELVCMEDLWKFPKWKYFFTLTGQEFPLKTNFELVKILTAYKGANDVMTTFKKANTDRWYNSRPPHGLKPVKGSVHIVVNRHYVNYILHNQTAKDLLNWTKKTFIPDETYFAILNANPQLGIKGTYKGEPEHTDKRPFLARYKHWSWDPGSCAGKYVRSICILTTEPKVRRSVSHHVPLLLITFPAIKSALIFGTEPRQFYCPPQWRFNPMAYMFSGDLPVLGKAKGMIANKFFIDWDRVVIGCLEEKIFNDTRDEYLGTKTFNTTYYSNLDLVKNQVT